MKLNKIALLMLASSVGLPNLVLAQEKSAEKSQNIEKIVVTGTNIERTIFDTPQTVSSFDESELRKFAASSQADVLTQLPGIAAEGGGGEVATNFFVRGLPSGGQFQFTPLEYDGIPAFSTFGLNSSAFDVYYRNDLGIDRLEYVTGGVSNLFGPGSVAGIINYVSKTGSDEHEGTLQLELADLEGRYRSDFALRGPIGGKDSATFYALSGFYRYDQGPLDSGLETEGFQLRGNIKHEFNDGSGSVTFYGQLIDDAVQFFLPIPLDGQGRNRITGNDGDDVYTVNSAEAALINYDTPNGRFETPIEDGVSTRGGSFAVVLDKELSDSWSINTKFKYAKYDHQFNLFLDGDGIVSLPETLQEFLSNRGYGDLDNASFTFTTSGQEVPTDYLLFANRILDRDRDATDFSGEFNLLHTTEFGDAEHNFTFGTFFSNTEADDINYITTYLADFRNNPKLVDLTVTDVDGSLTGTVGSEYVVAQNGLLNAGGLTGDRTRSAKRVAFYVADQIERDRWSYDVGVRIERFEGEVLQRNVSQASIGNDPLVNDDLENMGALNGDLVRDTVATTEWAASFGALYKMTNDVNLFGNFSRGFFFPQLNGQRFNEYGEFGPYEPEIILIGELGTKFKVGDLNAYAALFYSDLSDRQVVDFVNDGQGGVVYVVENTSTEAYGIEVGGEYEITDNLVFSGNITLREHEISQSESDPSLVGNELRRQPKVLVNTSIAYNDGTYDLGIFHNYHGDNYANSSNTVELDGYHLVRLEAGYTLNFQDDQRARFSIGVFNLFDSDGITEGSPRQGNNQTAEEAYFVGRPILPRRITARFTYDF